MGRKPQWGGIERMTFSFTRSIARKIRKMADRQGHTYTHFVSMACAQYYRMKVSGAWMCQGRPSSQGCTHLNSRTTEVCEICGALSYEAQGRADRAKADKILEEGPGTVIPIQELLATRPPGRGECIVTPGNPNASCDCPVCSA